MSDLHVCSVSVISEVNGGVLARAPKYLGFKYVDVQSGIRDSSQPEYAQVSPFMRSGKVLTYMGRSQRTVTALIRLVHDGEGSPSSPAPGLASAMANWWEGLKSDAAGLFDGAGGDLSSDSGGAFNSVVAPAQWLAALKDSYTGTDTIVHAPPMVEVWVGHIHLPKAVVISCDITYRGPWYHPGTSSGDGINLDGTQATPGQADVQVVFSEITGE